MRRLLLIAYHFPPQPTAGALRPKFLARYLPDFGWEPVVLTRPESTAPEVGCRVETAAVLGESVEESMREALSSANGRPGTSRPTAMRVILRKAKQAVSFPDRAVGWWLPAVAKGLELCDTYGFDAILSTAMPATAHLVGGTIARLRNLPWIADYRDPWSDNHMRERAGVRDAIERRFERRLLRRAAIVTAVPTIAATVELVLERSVVRIANAYDPSDWTGFGTIAPRRFELCHTGSLYDGLITPALLFEAIASLRAEANPAANPRLLFYGPADDSVAALARRYGIEEQLEQRGLVPHEEALAAQRSASQLLVFLKMDDGAAHVLGSKILEYCGSGRRIIAFGPRTSAMRAFIEENGLGWFASDLEEARNALQAAYALYAAGDWEIHPRADIVLDARSLARMFAEPLDAVSR
jgi:hypothetical protein